MELDETLAPPSIQVEPLSLKDTSNKPPIQSLNSSDTNIIGIPESKMDGQQSFELWRRLVLDLLRSTACYALMPDSGKVVVFDSCLTLKHAFRALSEHDIKCAPVWQSDNNSTSNGDFVGFMTVTDFADILHHYALDINSYSQRIVELETFAVGRWCTFRKAHQKTQISKKFVFCGPDEPLFNAIYKMHQYFIHRMPIRIEQAIGCILNHQNILRFVFNQTKTYHATLRPMTVKLLEMPYDHGEYKTVTYDQKVIVAVNMLSTNWKRSAIPICDGNGAVKDAFMRSDVRFFARNSQYMKANVITIKDFLGKYRHFAVPRCTEETPLLDVYEEMLNKRCHVALVLDEKDKLRTVFNCAQTFHQIIENEVPVHIMADNDDNVEAADQLTDSLDVSSHFVSD